MAIKQGDCYYAGIVVFPDGSRSMEELPDVRDDGRFGRMDCEYCYTDNVETVSSYEAVIGPSVQALCAECGAGLTPTEPL